jgi:hypothetical protein
MLRTSSVTSGSSTSSRAITDGSSQAPSEW